jgi:hypothetical protein
VTGPYGYPAQQPHQPREPGSGYGAPGYGYGQQAPQGQRPSGFTAILAAFFGLGLTGLAGYVPIHSFISIPSGYSLGDLTSGALTVLGVYLMAALLLLIGALATFFRSFGGGILLLIGTLLALAAFFLEPLLNLHGQYVPYFKYFLAFGSTDAILGAALVALSVLLLLLMMIPATFRYLRYRRPAPQGYVRQAQPYPPRSR